MIDRPHLPADNSTALEVVTAEGIAGISNNNNKGMKSSQCKEEMHAWLFNT